MSDKDLLALQYRTTFVIDSANRIVCNNAPDRSAGPALWMAGSMEGNVFGLRADVDGGIAAEIARLAAEEPPFVLPGEAPRHLDRYLALLTRSRTVLRYTPGMVYALPNSLPATPGVTAVDSETAQGNALQATLAANCMPDGLREMGFHDTSEFWPPWCVALFFGQPVAVCFAARISEAAAEVGVATVRNFRGRGFAAAATAGWSRMKALQSRALFYSTDGTNVSSQRVAARLGLRLIGNRMSLA